MQKKTFEGGCGDKRNYDGFNTCEKRTNAEHRKEAQEVLNQETMKDKQFIESKYGTRFTELMRLPYFDCVRFTVVDPICTTFLWAAQST